MKLLLFVLVLLPMFVACDSNELTDNGNNANKTLVLTPSSLDGEQFVAYQFKAELKTKPANGATYFWDFDEGQGKEEIDLDASGTTVRIFFVAKVHTVRVWAYDDSTNALLGADSIRVDIRPPTPFVKVIPQSTDTLLFVTSSGVPVGKLLFRLRTSMPENMIDAAWDFGDGSPLFQEQFTQATVTHGFTGAGTFTVRVTVKEKNGTLLGTDSTRVTIRMPEPSLSHLLNTSAISVWLAIDSSVDVINDPAFSNPFAVGMPIHLHPSSSFTDRSFTIVYEDKEDVTKLCLDTIRGTLSNDLRSINSVSVSVNDTGDIESGNGALKYSFLLTNLQFLAMTNDKIVYRSTSSTIENFAHDIQFYSSSPMNIPRGILDRSTDVNPPERKPGTYGLVVFTR